MNREPETIEHIPNEKRPGNGIWWILAGLGIFFWVGTGYLFGFNWHQVLLGFATGGALTAFAIEKSGNKVPGWMDPSPRKRFKDR